MSKSSRLNWHNPKARIGYKIGALLLIAYGAASWAIDNGSPWLYILTLVACYLAVHYVIQLFGALRRGQK